MTDDDINQVLEAMGEMFQGMSRERKLELFADMMLNDPQMREASIKEWTNPDYHLNDFDKMMIEKMLDEDNSSCSNEQGK